MEVIRKWWHWNEMKKEKSTRYSAEWTLSAVFYDFITFPINCQGKVPRVITTVVPSLRSSSARYYVENFFLKPEATEAKMDFCFLVLFMSGKNLLLFWANFSLVCSEKYSAWTFIWIPQTSWDEIFFISQWNTNETPCDKATWFWKSCIDHLSKLSVLPKFCNNFMFPNSCSDKLRKWTRGHRKYIVKLPGDGHRHHITSSCPHQRSSSC